MKIAYPFFVGFLFAVACQAQKGRELDLNPEKYLGKTVHVIAYIKGGDYKPLESLSEEGKYFCLGTSEYRRNSYGQNELVAGDLEFVYAFVPNEKINSFVKTYGTENPKPLKGRWTEVTKEEASLIVKKTKEKYNHFTVIPNFRFFINTKKDPE